LQDRSWRIHGRLSCCNATIQARVRTPDRPSIPAMSSSCSSSSFCLFFPRKTHTQDAHSRDFPQKTKGTHKNTLHRTHAMRIGSHVPNDVLFRGHDVRFWKWNGRYRPIVWWLFVLLREQGTNAEGCSLFPVPPAAKPQWMNLGSFNS
jgi:hypothetical protein